MASLNKVILVGNLTKDPELKFIPSGAAVCNMRMAMNRKWKDQAGSWKEEVTYISVVAWGKQGEAAGEYLKKGSPVLIEGRLQSRSWETEDGQKRSAVEVVAERVQFLTRREGQAGAAGAAATDAAPAAEGGSYPEGVTEDDIPF